MKNALLTAYFLSNIFFGIAQNLFYQDIYNGGVTAGGFSTGQGSGSGNFSLYIEPGSTIKKAYLFTYRAGHPSNSPIIINNNSYLFDSSNVLMQAEHSNPNFLPIHLYFCDFTDSLNASITSTFNVTVPSLVGLPIGWGYFTVYIYIAYENPALPKVATSLWINDKDFMGDESYSCLNMNPIDNSSPVCLSLFMDRACNNTNDGSNIIVNSTNIGIIGGPDSVNSLWNCSGAKGHFYYQNNTLFGLDDDTPDNLMDSADALADISSYLANNATGYDLQLVHNNNSNLGKPNVTPLFINAYSSPCDTFSTSAIEVTDTICAGDSVQLAATGGVNYKWWGAFGGISDTLSATPMAAPSQTCTYIVQITNALGCSKTEHIKVWVRPSPVPGTKNVYVPDCGSNNGSITATATGGTTPYTYAWNNGATTPNILDLSPLTYLLTITDFYGCADTLSFILDSTTGRQQAQLNPTPDNGTAPLWVVFENTTAGMSDYIWAINGDTLTEFEPNYTFDTAGTYQIALIAYNNTLACADTAYATVVVDSLTTSFITIPSVFSPNSDGFNDDFTLVTSGVSEIEITIFNRWGVFVKSVEWKQESTQNVTPQTHHAVWNGRTAAGVETPTGVYFYTLTYTIGEEFFTESRSITLVR